MNRYLVITALCISSLLSAQAEEVSFDQGIAAEIMRGTAVQQAAGSIGDNQQLLVNYRVVALEQAIAQEAAEMGLTERLDVQDALQQSRRQILVQARKEAMTRGLPMPTEDELKKAYEEQPMLWTLPGAYQVDVLELNRENERTMKKAEKLQDGEVVPDSKLVGLDARVIVSQASGQWLPRNMFAPDIWVQLPMMEEGTVRIFETAESTLLIRRGPYRQEQLLPFEQVKNNILLYLRNVKANEAWQKYLQDKLADLGL